MNGGIPMVKANKPQAQAKAREEYAQAAEADEEGDDHRATVHQIMGDYHVDRATGKYDTSE